MTMQTYSPDHVRIISICPVQGEWRASIGDSQYDVIAWAHCEVAGLGGRVLGILAYANEEKPNAIAETLSDFTGYYRLRQ